MLVLTFFLWGMCAVWGKVGLYTRYIALARAFVLCPCGARRSTTTIWILVPLLPTSRAQLRLRKVALAFRRLPGTQLFPSWAIFMNRALLWRVCMHRTWSLPCFSFSFELLGLGQLTKLWGFMCISPTSLEVVPWMRLISHLQAVVHLVRTASVPG